MTAYYNENDPYAARWLRNLIHAGHIADGHVDDRSIVDVRADDLRGYDQGHFFAGIGGWSLALRLAGWDDARPVWTGSCPCQPFSSAGKRTGGKDGRHLWPHWFRLIRELRPCVIFGENVEAAIGWGWLDAVLGDLEAEGYATGAAVLGAHSVGAPHIRQRVWFVAGASGERQRGGSQERDEHAGIGGNAGLLADAGRGRCTQRNAGERAISEPHTTGANPWHDLVWLPCTDGKARPTQPGLQPLAHGVPARVGRLRAYGNAITPQAAAEFIRAAMPDRHPR